MCDGCFDRGNQRDDCRRLRGNFFIGTVHSDRRRGNSRLRPDHHGEGDGFQFTAFCRPRRVFGELIWTTLQRPAPADAIIEALADNGR